MIRPKIDGTAERIWGAKLCTPESTREIRRQVKGRPRATHWRPQRRSQCTEDRPCPYVGCKFNLVLEIMMGGGLRYTRGSPDDPLAPWSGDVSNCMHDHMHEAGMTLDEIGVVLGMSRERVRQIEAVALTKIKKSAFAREVLSELMDYEPSNQGWVYP